ncbi:MAG TPA: ABC transporter permease, partial [Gemmatimonadales bacterium]
MKRARGIIGAGARIFEGMGMALDSVRANKVRASLTILGVAIGVMVVIAMASAITGINRAVSQQLETLGPRTFFVFRFFRGGLNISDGSDEMSPWRKNPWLTVEEAGAIRLLPSVKDVGYREGASGPVSHGDQKLSSVNMTGFTTNWVFVSGGTISQGRNWTDI